jgi:DNA polymerase I
MRVLLYDANHLAGRCNHVHKELTTSKGQPSGVIFGALQTLGSIKYKQRIQFQDTIMIWDGGDCKKRVEIYPQYKQGRRWRNPNITEEEIKARENYYLQILELQEGLSYLGIRQVQVPRMEADDIIGIIAGYHDEYLNQESTIVSGDYDFHQLATDRISIYHPKNGLMTKPVIEDYWHLPIYKIPLYKAIVGDTSDGICGIKGIGDIRAKMLLKYIESENLSPQLAERMLPKERKLYNQLLDCELTFKRNVRLVTIPTSFNTFMYEKEQLASVYEQMVDRQKQESFKFISWLKKWEMKGVLDQLGRWL